MNANELADKLTELIVSTVVVSNENSCILIDQAAAMLRQQQEKLTKYELRNIAQCDRIAILEAQVYGGITK